MLKVADLFAGIGGIRLGFERVFDDVECVFSSEIDKFAIQTYKANFNETPSGDITKIKSDEIPDFDMLLAGFPCQPFSSAGLKKGFFDERGGMFFEVVRILRDKKPSMFLLENVKNLKSHNDGNTLEFMIKSLRNLGYDVCFEVLKARDFGLPQNRERIYIVGFNFKTNFIFPKPLNIKTKLNDILEKNVDEKYTISDRLWQGHQRRKIENKKAGKGFGYGLFDKNSEYVNTLSARYYKDGSEILIEQIGKNPRKLTPRECARLQGFKDSFTIPVSNNQAYRQFGNSVAINVIENIAKEIKKALKYCEMKKASNF
ncbi:DNA cytosine methyltransferase [Campylobacter ureolyticus]|uniref:DNA cytosine methyltransferase n=1 Tax=Campylobacter ureolyticus TaxID=827 RepID=UPI002908A437|nr:DNA cytosine methyltransferase [Campylobacter ureolyticus]MDU5324974.1 DNA cytosine methyltransferase [Campylobacter ureolyticus]